jgi:translation initiation factor IF-3
VLERVVGDLKDVAVIEAVARMEGRQMFMILAPNPRMLQSQRDRAKAQVAAAGAATAVAGAAAPAASAAPTPAPEAGGNETGGSAS